MAKNRLISVVIKGVEDCIADSKLKIIFTIKSTL